MRVGVRSAHNGRAEAIRPTASTSNGRVGISVGPVVRCEMSDADVDSVPNLANALIGGVRGAVGYGLRWSKMVRAICICLAMRSTSGLVAYVFDPLGSIRLRIANGYAGRC